jgi:16S rRNA (uracil1498-N3)-methyltransferase
VQFLYNQNASNDYIELEKEDFNYIFKVRRTIKSNILYFRNMQDNTLYKYELIEKTKKIAKYKLKTFTKDKQKNKKFHLAISIIDIKEIEKMIPFLNELEVFKISFIYSKYSQKNIKINLEKIKKILINSSQQCGRNIFIQIDEFDNIKDFLIKYPHSYILHFNKTLFNQKIKEIQTIIVGPEGGFSDEEVDLFDKNKKVGLNTSSILRTTTACIHLASLKI